MNCPNESKLLMTPPVWQFIMETRTFQVPSSRPPLGDSLVCANDTAVITDIKTNETANLDRFFRILFVLFIYLNFRQPCLALADVCHNSPNRL